MSGRPTADIVADLTPDQRAAIAGSVAGGIVGYVQRIRVEHGPTFARTTHVSDRYPNGVVYAGCRCREVGCPRPLLIQHVEDLRQAYEAKVADLARETLKYSEAADRLAELDAEVAKLAADCMAVHVENRRIAALLPDCPRCDGEGEIAQYEFGQRLPDAPCPDCPPDGKVSVEQLAATWRAVHNSATWVNHSRDEAEIILRAVKP